MSTEVILSTVTGNEIERPSTIHSYEGGMAGQGPIIRDGSSGAMSIVVGQGPVESGGEMVVYAEGPAAVNADGAVNVLDGSGMIVSPAHLDVNDPNLTVEVPGVGKTVSSAHSLAVLCSLARMAFALLAPRPSLRSRLLLNRRSSSSLLSKLPPTTIPRWWKLLNQRSLT